MYHNQDEKTLKAIARYLTGTQIMDMLEKVNSGIKLLKAPRGQTLSDGDVRFIASYLRLA